MKKHSTIDYLACIAVKLLGPVIRSLRPSAALFLGRRLGDLLYCFDRRHKAVVYSNLKVAFGKELPPHQLTKLSRDFYRSFGQNLIEVFFIPLVNSEYIKKYISFEGIQFVTEALKENKGVIFVSVHAGSWEFSNVICANAGFPFNVFVNDQRYPRLNELLNRYRARKGCKIISRQGGIRELIGALKRNEAIGLTTDQGGKNGTLVDFFGLAASMATGALKLALKYGAVILPAFYTRVGGPYIKAIIMTPFRINKSPDLKRDVQENLQRLIAIFERQIRMYPREYLWSYKIWKYTLEKNILLLSDGVTGHLRQAQALANIVSELLKGKGIAARVNTLEVKFKSRFSRYALASSGCLAAKFQCQGCLWCLKTFLSQDVYNSLIYLKPDIIVSCGSSVAALNLILSRENLSKSVAIMRPSILNISRFDLVVMPQHDKPPRKRNVAVTEGALNLINERYLKEESEKLIRLEGTKLNPQGLYIGLLLGGDAKNFSLKPNTVLEAIKEVKAACAKLGADILVTTSRRTSRALENMVREAFEDYLACKLMIIANQKNIPQAVGGILGLSRIVISSPESISMVSEAINSNRYVFIFKAPGLNRRHLRFLKNAAKNKYLYLTEPSNLGRRIEDIWKAQPAINTTRDNLLVSKAVGKIL